MDDINAHGRISFKAKRSKKLKEELEEQSGRTDTSSSNNNEEYGSSADSNSISSAPPYSYTANTAKEDQCLEYLETTSASMAKSHPAEILTPVLTAQNEYGVSKPMCTFIRPTLLPYPSLYVLRDILMFVFRFVDNEPIQGNNSDVAATSPQQTIDWRVGDSLDKSILLTSLLIGAGYDAYVVCGTAPKWLCDGDTGLLEAPVDWKNGNTCKNNIGAKNSDEKKRGWMGLALSEVPQVQSDSDNVGTHAWVLVRPGRRGQPEEEGVSAIYADPSVGRIWSAESEESDDESSCSPYTCIQTVFNHTNQWVNTTPTAALRSCIDLDNSNAWQPIYGNCATEGASEQLSLVMSAAPLSWASKVDISRSDFELQYPPYGRRFELYRKAKLEIHTGQNGSDSARKLTRYLDEDRMEEAECLEWYGGDQGRAQTDHLKERRVLPLENRMKEAYSPFHPVGLKHGSETYGIEREISFHARIRVDGLVCRREVFGELIEETFEDRPDSLTQRIIQVKSICEGEYAQKNAVLLTKSDGGEIAVVSVEERYGSDDEVKASLEEEDTVVASRAYHLLEGKIEATILHNDGVDMISSTESIAKDDDSRSEEEAFRSAILAEREALASIRAINKDILHLCRMRYKEEKGLRNSNMPHQSNSNAEEQNSSDEEEKEDKEDIELKSDYLSPFLVGVHNPENISPGEAARIKDACLGSLKQRLLQRAEMMQSRLDDERSILSKASKERDVQGKESLERFNTSRIRIWEERLASHEEVSLQKFVALEDKLDADPRLQALHV